MGTRRPLITLTSDFGTRDPFVGQMKGVILNTNPDVELVDISHEISPHNIREGAVLTGMSYEYFPVRTIHLVVVDPGVGSSRRPIIVATQNHYFVGPDNGVFSMVYRKEKDSLRVIHITSEHYFLKKDSTTFHGRDIFAPVAAWLSKGIPVDHFGVRIDDFMNIHLPEPGMPSRNTIEGEVIYIDRFGNAITNISSDLLNDSVNGGGRLRIVLKGRVVPVKSCYAEVDDKELYCLINSFGFLEFFICRGNAAESFGIRIGDTVGIIKG
ncbi:MAG: SAM-dependent chlorinase/fluorinase [Nitrospirae bacterium]|nr:SAM-dependent chlorinase/fluorinase [Nitrospirota bacterium]